MLSPGLLVKKSGLSFFPERRMLFFESFDVEFLGSTVEVPVDEPEVVPGEILCIIYDLQAFPFLYAGSASGI